MPLDPPRPAVYKCCSFSAVFFPLTGPPLIVVFLTNFLTIYDISFQVTTSELVLGDIPKAGGEVNSPPPSLSIFPIIF